MKKSISFFFAISFTVANSPFIQAQNTKEIQNTEYSLSKIDKQYFIENKGQWHPDVLYLTRMKGLDVWITKTGVNYNFYKIEKSKVLESQSLREHQPSHIKEIENSMILGHRVIVDYIGANTNPEKEGRQKQQGYYNYFIGNDPSKYATNVGLYKEVIVKNVYSGIDIRYYFDKGNLRYDFVVQPGADPTQIQFQLRGQYEQYLKDGKLVFTTRFGEVSIQDLNVYQSEKLITSNFTNDGNTWQIALGQYNKYEPLVIDPLVYSTYLGGGGTDQGRSIKVDANGNVYVSGYTYSTNYDVTSGAYQTTHGGPTNGYDVFVTKLNPSGNVLGYSTYIGGSGIDWGIGIDIDGSNNVYVSGYTNSLNYPTMGAYQSAYGGGGYDAFVTKLNSTGNGLVYSTYIGGSGSDFSYDMTIDASGNVYVTGATSGNYDITSGSFQATYDGGLYDVFVTKLNSNGNTLLYSTYIGGNKEDVGYAIDVDATGNAYVTGITKSTNYDVTTGIYQNTHTGNAYYDVFVTKLNSNGSALVYSTYLGGSDNDYSKDIVVDVNGNAYITGYTISNNYDITGGAYQTTHGGPPTGEDVFVTKLNNTGSNLIYSTYIGGIGYDEAYGITIDASGNVYITGRTNDDYDITTNVYQSTYDGGSWDVFVTKLNNAGNGLLYSTYIGGGGSDEGYGIAIDGSGNVYVAGATNSNNYDITTGAYQTSNDGGFYDAFVTKLGIPTNIEELKNISSSFYVYPNPNTGLFTVQTKNGGTFDITDITGRVLQRISFKESVKTIELQLPSGIYFVKDIESGAVTKVMVK